MKSLIVWDLETTGFVDNPDARIIEIGAVVIRDGEVHSEQSWVLNHGIEIPEKITEITGITKEIIEEEGVNPDIALSEFIRLLVESDLHLTHNGFKFDIPFLIKQLKAIPGTPDHSFNFFQQCLEANGLDSAVMYKARQLDMKIKEGESVKQFADRVMNVRAKGVFFNVGHCCDDLGISREGVEQHRALADVKLTWEIFKKLIV